MKAVVQRVKRTTLSVDGALISEIPFGLTVYLGVKTGDTEKEAAYLAKKIAALRIFEDENGKMNRSIQDIDGEMLVVSNFTLLANYVKGNRPDYFGAAKPDYANELYEYFASLLDAEVRHVGRGRFGAHMEIDISADGPVIEPYNVYMQGGLTYESGKIGILSAAKEMMKIL